MFSARYKRLPARTFSSTRKIFSTNIKRITKFVDDRPMSSFFVVLGLLFLLIFAGSILRKPKVETATVEAKPKEVSVYSVGTSPKITVQAQVEKSGVVKIVALTPGVVSRINVVEGQTVGRGATLVSLSTNYQGGNAQGVQAQIANRQYQNTLDTFPTQIDLLNKQRDAAKKTDENSDKLRDITNQSVSDTKSVIDYNNQSISNIDASIAVLEAGNIGGVNDPAIAVARAQRAQIASANAQLNSSVRNSEFQASNDNAPAKLSDLQKDIALQQLDLQQKSLELGKDISRLQLSLAQVLAAQMAPGAPFAGTVERINVRVGQVVNPGTVLLTLSGNKSELTAVAQVPGSIARAVSMMEDADFEIDGKVYQVRPTYVSGEATDGSLYSIIFTLDKEVADLLADNGFVNIHVPVGVVSDDGSTLVPLDAVHQTQDSTYIFVADGDRAASKTVTLGTLQGKFVKVVSGLSTSDKVILSRNIVGGDKISIVQ